MSVSLVVCCTVGTPSVAIAGATGDEVLNDRDYDVAQLRIAEEYMAANCRNLSKYIKKIQSLQGFYYADAIKIDSKFAWVRADDLTVSETHMPRIKKKLGSRLTCAYSKKMVETIERKIQPMIDILGEIEGDEAENGG